MNDFLESSKCSMIVSVGYQKSHIVPVILPDLPGCSISPNVPKPLINASRRLQFGGTHISWLLQRLLQLKYPCHADRITNGIVEVSVLSIFVY